MAMRKGNQSGRVVPPMCGIAAHARESSPQAVGAAPTSRPQRMNAQVRAASSDNGSDVPAVPYPAYDERESSRAGHRQEAMDALWWANHLVAQAEDEDQPPDWEHVRYWQRDAQVHALLALSAVDS